ncbi:unnamed protein product [Vitrella brassicaformis CCMP3155]|uniref:Uncharacterized protein n=2 Tax=Vitrella brassicaformis TaxID=1169539 RepID=A0A0G4FCY7_VITBC|nr:unnamed protein product [Vitrella brassicaformis CCMP3155]|mmetsp:Transcript_34216/g.84724  ORF Transcript_34216/g.84724 Transcript_34216/m.84724 type:complete len:188 (+) Transcript_34216:404-967(+)|eukprot:CEM11096.1 unnamed protein product [Vitrella brassicaformis CCMP3155]
MDRRGISPSFGRHDQAQWDHFNRDQMMRPRGPSPPARPPTPFRDNDIEPILRVDRGVDPRGPCSSPPPLVRSWVPAAVAVQQRKPQPPVQANAGEHDRRTCKQDHHGRRRGRPDDASDEQESPPRQRRRLEPPAQPIQQQLAANHPIQLIQQPAPQQQQQQQGRSVKPPRYIAVKHRGAFTMNASRS